uniref:Mos1 transposase HTH domain-containing protein n=1 Tax=Amphilophus citrinellus TaxID=61819 RepID=A0A3Q0SZE6_AMPCI
CLKKKSFHVAARNESQRLKFEQREKIKFCIKSGQSAKKTFQILQEVYGTKAMSWSRCFDWYLRFKRGRVSVDDVDDDRSGRTTTSKTPKHIREIDRLVRQDFRITIREISAILNVSFGTVHAILASNLNLHQVAHKFVPRLLTPAHKQYRFQVCEDLYDQARDDPTFISRIITGDESWVYSYKPNTKQPGRAKVNQVRTKTKAMLITFFDIHGVVHREFVPEGQAVDAQFYLSVMQRLRENIQIKRPELWQKGNWLLHHDNTSAHNALKECHFFCYNNTNLIPHPYHSPDLAPCDFFLFPKINSKLKGQFFDTVEELQHASLMVLDNLKEEDFQSAFKAWQQRWVCCTAAQGNYFTADGGHI